MAGTLVLGGTGVYGWFQWYITRRDKRREDAQKENKETSAAQYAAQATIEVAKIQAEQTIRQDVYDQLQRQRKYLLELEDRIRAADKERLEMMAQWNKERLDMSAQIAELQSEKAAAMMRDSSLQMQMRELREENATLKEANSTLTMEVERLNGEIVTLQDVNKSRG